MRLSQLFKRAFDCLMASAALILLSPVLLLVALAIWILEGRPIFYVSQRFVEPERAIPVYKFRTMVRDAKDPKYRLRERFMRDGYLDIPRTCEVYTPIGRLLERLQIVEVPQMLNVLLHGMSLIGNRPLPAENVRLLQKYPNWRKRFESPAGITGIAQVVGKLRLSPEQRLALEGAYSDRYRQGRVFWADLRIILETAKVILFSRSLSMEEAFHLVGAEVPEALREVKPARTATAAG